MAFEYYALVYIGQTVEEPAGVIRRDGFKTPERYDFDTNKWEPNSELLRYFVGLSDEAERISEDHARSLGVRI